MQFGITNIGVRLLEKCRDIVKADVEQQSSVSRRLGEFQEARLGRKQRSLEIISADIGLSILEETFEAQRDVLRLTDVEFCSLGITKNGDRVRLHGKCRDSLKSDNSVKDAC